MSYLMGINDKVSNCYVCAPAAVKHRHCSTRYYYTRCYNLGREAECFTCLDPDHPPQFKGRLKLLSTSSTLHHVHEARTYESELMKTVEEMGAAFHIDVDQIAGGRIDDLRKSWYRQYWNEPLPIDIAVVCGLNDIPHLTADQFMFKLQHWRDLVAEHSVRHQHETPNTFAFSTPLRAPKYYWHPANRFPPPQGYINYKDKIDELIIRIDRFNSDGGVEGMVRLHMEGDRKVDGEWEHMWKQWREYHVEPGQIREHHEFLHLTDEKRVKCFMKIIKYFFHQTDFPKTATPPDVAASPAVHDSSATPTLPPANVTPALIVQASPSPPASSVTPTTAAVAATSPGPAANSTVITMAEGRKMRGLYVRLRNIKADRAADKGSLHEASSEETRSVSVEQAPDMRREVDPFSMEGEDWTAEDFDPKTCPNYMLDPHNKLDESD